ncbi:ribosomal L28 family-domain-containing protein [Ampelomyces quisqualis]|uniref:Large ribosomal subunit protein bL28m n=1 Tax=Ampelomyces quisqualis TaxID=50730 RepID=A0A6A5QQR9_AMPQU|nr:ribosomal L28 family-domain-containing protein [Ampelomyces quisqualis]
MAPRGQLLSRSLDTPRLVVRTSQATQRTYSTAEPAPIVKNPLKPRKGGDLGSHLPKHVIPADAYIPAYPYGDHTLFKQANHGLYGLQMIHFGNNVSEKTNTKTRRYWKPNVIKKSLYSVALKKRIKLRITSQVLKTMDREGGLDRYLLRDNENRVKELGPLGWALRWTLMQRPEIRDKMRAEAAALGVDQATIDAQWPTQQMLAEQRTSARSLVKASELIPQAYEEAEEGGGEEDDKIISPLTKREKLVAHAAGPEYDKAIKAAQRYLGRENVETEEDGIKLAFIREKERKMAAESLKQKFADRLKDQFSDHDVAETRKRFNLPAELPDEKVRTIAYNQSRRQQIEEMGSYDAWRDKMDAEKLSSRQIRQNPQTQAEYREEYMAAIAEAEGAATNESLPHDKRRFLEYAIIKANIAIKAKNSGGKIAYINMMIERTRQPKNVSLRTLSRKAAAQQEDGSDAWASLVQVSSKHPEGRQNM